VANQCLIGASPFLFFRRDGHYPLRWWLVAFPFDISALGVWLGMFGQLAPLRGLTTALMGWTVGSHRVLLALWHQDNNDPVGIVT
jgi:hypothetical protein